MKKKLLTIISTMLIINVFGANAIMAQNTDINDTGTEITDTADELSNIALVDSINIEQAEQGILPKAIYKYKVIANNVNVRKSPSTSASTLGQMNWGDVCYSSAVPVSGDGLSWLYVTCGSPLTGVKGYIATKYLQEVAD